MSEMGLPSIEDLKEAYFRQMENAPTNDTIRLVYADWLEEELDEPGHAYRLMASSSLRPTIVGQGDWRFLWTAKPKTSSYLPWRWNLPEALRSSGGFGESYAVRGRSAYQSYPCWVFESLREAYEMAALACPGNFYPVVLIGRSASEHELMWSNWGFPPDEFNFIELVRLHDSHELIRRHLYPKGPVNIVFTPVATGEWLTDYAKYIMLEVPQGSVLWVPTGIGSPTQFRRYPLGH